MSATRGSKQHVDYKQVELVLTHPSCWTLAVTAQHPGTHIIERSLYPADDRIKGDFVFVSTGDTDMDRFITSVEEAEAVEDVTTLTRSTERARAVVIYDHDTSVVPEITNSEFMPIEPVHITDGKERWTVLVRSDRLGEIIDEMKHQCDVDISAIHEVDPDGAAILADVVDQLHESLSERQRECLFDAQEAGYYEWPREITASDIAEETGVSGPTFLEHIRRGEHKALHAILDELRARHDRHR